MAVHLHQCGHEGLEWLLRGTEWLGMVTGKEISRFPPGLLVTGIALGLLIPVGSREAARGALFVGLPLAWLLPRWRRPWMFIPWFIAVARIANHHFVSDVGLSIVMVGAITLCLAPLARQREAPG